MMGEEKELYHDAQAEQDLIIEEKWSLEKE